jgi:hypothetical protein
MKIYLFFLLTVVIGLQSLAQPISKADLKILQKKQDTLTILSWRTANEQLPTLRLISDSVFTRVLVRALKTNNSFYFPFDSVQIAKVYAPDSAFRIFTWEIKTVGNKYRQKGVIQYRTADGKLKIAPLIDNSDFVEGYDKIGDARNWTGALYYNILLNENAGKKFYTLLGFDNNNEESNKKWIEVLTFDENNMPIFGAPVFAHKTKGDLNRFQIEYKKEARLKLNWDEEQEMIIFDHTSSESGFTNQRKTYVPDGDYEGFKWENGKWVHQEKVMCNCPLSLKDTKEQIAKPIFDANGNRIDNIPQAPTPPKKPKN